MKTDLTKPIGITYDMLYEIRRIMRRLRAMEKRLTAIHRAEKRIRAKSNEWEEMHRIGLQEKRKGPEGP